MGPYKGGVIVGLALAAALATAGVFAGISDNYQSHHTQLILGPSSPNAGAQVSATSSSLPMTQPTVGQVPCSASPTIPPSVAARYGSKPIECMNSSPARQAPVSLVPPKEPIYQQPASASGGSPAPGPQVDQPTTTVGSTGTPAK
jgi:hypothetical protein